MINKIKKKCKLCKKEYYVVPSQKDRSKYCSIKCRMASLNSFLIKEATKEELEERYIKSFDKYVVRQEGCWGWKGSKNDYGYAMMSCNRKIGDQRAHRASWIIHNGPIPNDKVIRHLCNNPICTNINHLALGSKQDNTNDMIKANRHSHGGKHKGAKLTEKQVFEIKKKLYKDEISCTKLANEFNVSRKCISDIKLNKNWKHITLEELK